MVKVDNHIQIYGWMTSGFGLHGKELIVFAIIYGFCQDGASRPIAPSYFQEWVSVKKRELLYIVSGLRDKGLVNVDIHPGRTTSYSVNLISILSAIRKAVEAEGDDGRQDTLPNYTGKRTLNEEIRDRIAEMRKRREEASMTPEELRRHQQIRDVIMNSDWTVH